MPLKNKIILVLSFLVIGITIYSNTFNGGFHFDDTFYIENNTAIRNLANFKEMWNISGCKARIVAFYSFALDYLFSQKNVFGYHVTNFTIHFINTFLVWVLANLLITIASSPGSAALKEKNIISYFAALLFLVHPLQTQAVTYLSQRFASLATLFYLLSVCFYIKARLALEDQKGQRMLFFVSAGLSAILGMFTKEIVFTLPVMIVLIEFYFFRQSAQNANRKYARALVSVALALMIIIPALFNFDFDKVFFKYESPSQSHVGDTVTFRNYPLTQIRVMATYLRLLFLPINQNLDYDYKTSQSLFELPTFLSFLLLIAILLIALKLRRKEKLISFGLLWFFIASSIESSIIPIRHVIFEHRMYLPIVGFCLVAADSLFKLAREKSRYIMLMFLIVAVFAAATYRRNAVWKDEMTLWQDVVNKSPYKSRPYLNLGLAYMVEKKYDKALEYFKSALKYNPLSFQTYNNIGGIYQAKGDYDSAVAAFTKAIKLNVSFEEAYVNRGAVYIRQGKNDLAFADFDFALKMKPDFEQAYINRGYIYLQRGKHEQALADYKKAIKLNPYSAEGYNGTGIVCKEKGEYGLALQNFNRALEINPQMGNAYNNRGNVYQKLDRLEEALSDFNNAISLDPLYHEAYNNRAIIFKKQERYSKALDDLGKAIQVEKKFSEAYLNRGNIYRMLKQYDAAKDDYNKAIEINPGSAVFYYNRSLLYAEIGNLQNAYEDAVKAKGLGYPDIEKYLNDVRTGINGQAENSF